MVDIDFKEKEIDLILMSLWNYVMDLEDRIEETRSVLHKTGEINKYSRTTNDNYTFETLNTDVKTLRKVKRLISKLSN